MNSAESLIARPAGTVGTAASPRSVTVQIWAFFGALLLIFELYVWFKWITGPYFTPVPTGVTDPPLYMKLFLGGNAAILAAGLPFAIWYFWIKPWRDERRITLDGMLILALKLKKANGCFVIKRATCRI